jgi:hypothetical protein
MSKRRKRGLVVATVTIALAFLVPRPASANWRVCTYELKNPQREWLCVHLP